MFDISHFTCCRFFEIGALLEIYNTWTQIWPHCIIGSLNSNNPFSLTPSPRLVVTPFCPSSSPSILLFQSLLWSLLIYDPMRSHFLHFDCVNEPISQWELANLLQGTKNWYLEDQENMFGYSDFGIFTWPWHSKSHSTVYIPFYCNPFLSLEAFS